MDGGVEGARCAVVRAVRVGAAGDARDAGLSLLLPAVLLRRGGAWQPAESFRGAFWDVARIVTAFTGGPLFLYLLRRTKESYRF